MCFPTGRISIKIILIRTAKYAQHMLVPFPYFIYLNYFLHISAVLLAPFLKYNITHTNYDVFNELFLSLSHSLTLSFETIRAQITAGAKNNTNN